MWVLEKTIEIDCGEDFFTSFRLEIFRQHKGTKYRIRFLRYEMFDLQPFGGEFADKRANCELLILDPFLDGAEFCANGWEEVLESVILKLEKQGIPVSK